MKTITIPKSVEVIEEYAFAFCGVSEVILQEGLKRIEQYAFRQCGSLRWISLPSSITYLGYNIFDGDYWSGNVLDELWCYATVAPKAEDELGIETGILSAKCKLFIPKGSTGYTGHPWDRFGEIIEF